jgi:hypothetical protein
MANNLITDIDLQNLPAIGEELASALSRPRVTPHSPSAGPLCERCSRFDIQSFTKTQNRTRGYKLSDVETSAADNCRFCLLLLDSVKGLDPPDPFYISTFGALKSTKPELYIHMTLSENFDPIVKNKIGPFRFNRLHTAIGDRFDEVRSHSEIELCVTVDPGA